MYNYRIHNALKQILPTLEKNYTHKTLSRVHKRNICFRFQPKTINIIFLSCLDYHVLYVLGRIGNSLKFSKKIFINSFFEDYSSETKCELPPYLQNICQNLLSALECKFDSVYRQRSIEFCRLLKR